jgi:hypothetical protein
MMIIIIIIIHINSEVGYVTSHPVPMVEDHTLLAVQNCLCNIYTAALHMWKSLLLLQREDVLYCVDMESLCC